ncbi:MAG: hypothetical protein M9899_11220 [Bdellovibrionaceae bacterium]|nr:hypothetical protein [Pseudobdellovibrionaceae bacterium]
MRTLSLLVFSTVYLSFCPTSLTWAAKSKTLDLDTASNANSTTTSSLDLHSGNSLHNGGFCYEILAGNSHVGFILETKAFNEKNGHHEQKLYTYLHNKTSSLEEQLNTTSDTYFSPIAFQYKLSVDNKISKELTGKFKKNAQKFSVDYTQSTPKNKSKTQTLVIPKGTVFLSRVTDLIFSQKKIEDFKPKQELVVQVFDAKTGKLKSSKSHLDQNSDGIKLIHNVDGKNFSTEHTYHGHLLRSVDQRQNITLARCKSVEPHIKTAETHSIYKTFFAQKEKEILKSCCQL